MFVFPAPYVAAAGGLTLTQEDSATSTAETISVPAGVQAGDLLILKDFAGGFGIPSAVTPSGFTQISTLGLENRRQSVLYKIADGTETTLTGMDGFGHVNKELYMFRGDSAISSVSVESLNEEAVTGTPSGQSVTASGGTAPLIVIGAYGTQNGQNLSPRTFTPDKDGEINSANYSYLAYKIYNDSPADVSISMQDEGTANFLQSFYIECS